jgi:hypothetical protein
VLRFAPFQVTNDDIRAQGQLKVAQLQGEAQVREISLLEDKVKHLSCELDATKAELGNREQVLCEARTQIQALKTAGNAHEETISNAQRKLMALEGALARSKQEEATALQERNVLQRDLPRLKTEIENMHAEFSEKKIEYTATIRMFEEQLRVSVEEAARLCKIDACLAQTRECEAEARQRVWVLEREKDESAAQLGELKQQLQRVQNAHDSAVKDLNASNSELARMKEERRQLKAAVEESERAKLDLRKDLGILNLEVDRVREDNQGLNKRVTTVATVENELKEVLLQKSVIERNLSANEVERRNLETENTRLGLKEKELERLAVEMAQLKSVSWQLINAMSGYKLQHQGVGMTVCLDKGAILVKHLDIAGSAARSELKCGDVLLSINGRKLAGLSVERVQSLILGPAGTQVRITARSSERSSDKHTVVLHRGFDKTGVVKNLVEEAEESCSAAMQLQRDLAASKDCLDTVCVYHRQRYLEIARLVSCVVRLLKQPGRDGIAFGREGLAEILTLLDNGSVAVGEEDLQAGCDRSDTSEKSFANGESMYLGVDPDVFKQALEKEKEECSGMLGALLKATQELLSKYQQHARNTCEVKVKDGEVNQLNTSLQQLESQLKTTVTQKTELAKKLEKCVMELKGTVGEKNQMDKMNLDLTRASTSAAARIKDLEKVCRLPEILISYIMLNV